MADAAERSRLRRGIGHTFRTLRIRDFRLYWFGAFFSFIGSWIQNTGQQWLVFDLTGSAQALGLMTFIGAAPMFFLSPFGGWLADRANKRVVLVVCQALFALSAFFLAVAVWQGFATFWLITAVAFINGCTSVVEIPTRQSMISHIVPPDDLASALPLSAGTFNTARIIGPAIGGFILGNYGPAACYLINGLSFSALIFAVLAIHADLRSTSDRSASLKETLFEGIRFVSKAAAFRTLVIMMIITATCAMFYISLISAFAGIVLNTNAQGFGYLLTSTGVGAIVGLITIASLSSRNIKGWIPIVAMTGLGASLMVVSLTRELAHSCMALGFMGFFGVGQMVGTNTALQYFSPPELRGRVISVHVWSMAGMNPVGALIFGWLAERIGLPSTFLLGGAIVFTVGLMALLFAKSVKKSTMKKRRKRPTHIPVAPGAPPATLAAAVGVTGETKLSIIAYDGEIREESVSSIDEAKAALSDCRVLWLDVDGVGDVATIEKLGKAFGFHPLALEDAINRNQRAKVEDYGDYYYIAVHAPKLTDSDLVAEQLSLFLGKNFVVTVHHRMDEQMSSVRDILRKRRVRITEFGSDFLAYSILDSVIDQYFPVLESFGELTDATEDKMLLKPDRNTVKYVHGLKRELLDLRRAIWPFRDALVSLMRTDETQLISEETMPYFRDLYDHTVRIIDLVETYREISSDLMDVYLSSVSNRTNDVMKRLTAITTIIMPLTLITGIYGMNFDNMPETRHPYGYFAIVGIMLLIAVLLFGYFWRQGWITVESDDED